MIIKYLPNQEALSIPGSVTHIGEWAFYNCKSLTSIAIPNSVTIIDEYAFENCTSLTSITISNNVTSISKETFKNCTNLKSITIPNGVTSIGDCAFENCTSLTSITIPNGVISIGNSAFYGCTSLESITIPDSVTSIGGRAFANCTSLKSIKIPNSVTSIDGCAFANCTSLESITIPDSVTSIGNSAFEDCENLTSITIHNTIINIGKGVFENCKKLNRIIIHDSITNISDDYFEFCEFLADFLAKYFEKIITGIKISNSTTSIGYSDSCQIENMTICKDNINVSFGLYYGDLITSDYQSALHCFIFNYKKRRKKYFNELRDWYKIPLALFMVFAYPHETYYSDYLKNNAEDTGRYLIDEENIDLLYRFLDFGFVTEKNIDSLISYAVEHTQNGGSAEPQLILSKYKSDNFSCHGADSFDNLML